MESKFINLPIEDHRLSSIAFVLGGKNSKDTPGGSPEYTLLIIGSILLAVSRAIGETMIVVMAAGLAANLTINPLESTTTITTQIVMILVGDQEFDSPKTQAAFALGLTLFIATLFLNYIALRVVKKYREKYD